MEDKQIAQLVIGGHRPDLEQTVIGLGAGLVLNRAQPGISRNSSLMASPSSSRDSGPISIVSSRAPSGGSVPITGPGSAAWAGA
jgi:hypothetical protein